MKRLIAAGLVALSLFAAAPVAQAEPQCDRDPLFGVKVCKIDPRDAIPGAHKWLLDPPRR